MTGPESERVHGQPVWLPPDPKPRTWPVAPKAYGALGGAGTGAAIAAVVVSMLQTYVTHGPLSAAAIQAIYAIVPAVLAFCGAWLAPHQPRPVPKTPFGHSVNIER